MSGTARRWTGTGRSSAPSGRLAGCEAAAGALDGRRDAALLVVFASDSYDATELLAGVREVGGSTPLIGCSTSGEIGSDGPGDHGVVVMALGGPGFVARTASAEIGSRGLRGAGAEVARVAAEVDERPHRALVLLSDGLAGDQEELVRGVYGVLGASVPMVGGCAGDDLRMERTTQLHDDRVLTGSVVAAVLGSDAPLGIGVSHGWRRVGEPMLVTDSSENRVLTLDDQPALDVYLQRLDAPPEAWTDPAAFTRFALTHPLGISRRRGEHVRFVAEADFADRSLGCVAHVPRGGLAWFMEGDDDSVLEATDAACAAAIAPLGGQDPVGILAFDCIARRGVLEDRGLSRETTRLSASTGGAPVAGFYTYGEIARTGGPAGSTTRRSSSWPWADVPASRSHWSTQQLTELLSAVAELPDSGTILRRGLEHVAESLECEVASMVAGGIVLHCLGFPEGAAPVAELADAAAGTRTELAVPGAGCCTVVVADCDGVPGGRLVLARSPSMPFTHEERALLRGMAQVLGLSLQARRLVDEERTHRRLSEAHAEDNARLLASLRERQTLLERLSRIQRSISSRQPLNDVLDAITAGAAELLGEDIVGLRLVDTEDPRYMLMVSSIGVPASLAAATTRQPVGQGIGGKAIVENRLVHTSNYPSVEQPLPGFAADGILAAMACPVRQGSTAVGSLVVATRRPNRVYSASEQEALTAFAEHVSLALNDAQSVQALHRAVDEATRQSLHDSLTGLPNRALFLDRLAHAAERSQRQDGAPFTVLFIDVDDFKVVNDSLGHLVGDRLLTAVAARILSSLRTQDTVARLGGDEFAVLLEEAGDEDATAAAERVLRALREPFDLPGGQTVHVSASIGLVTSSGAGSSAEELLRDADVAMYRAKGEGKHRYVVFEPAMRDRLQARTELESELRRAVLGDQFTVHYQPVVDARTGTVVSTEALLRWEHPRRGLVSPAEFVPLAEDTGLIVAMGGLVLREACRQTAEWRRSPELADLTLSVNLSPRQLQEPLLLEEVRDALATSGLPACALVLEITENLLVRDIEQATHRLNSLKALGVRLAVDDFGTGYSSLSYLSRLPVDILKVDKAFVAGIASESSAGKLAWAVLALAESLDLETVAEGVETPEQVEALLAQGCTRLQGYLFSRPVPGAVLPGTAAALRDRMQLAATALRAVPGARTPLAEVALPR